MPLMENEPAQRDRARLTRQFQRVEREYPRLGHILRVLRKGFYKALVEAKGYKLPSSSSSGGGGTRGRQAEFKTRVHGNGNLLIGHAYTRRLGLEPGQEFRIELRQDSRSIWLLPMNNEELKVAEVGSEPDQDTNKDPS